MLGIDPIHRARVGVDCSWASNPPPRPGLLLLLKPPGEVAPELVTVVPLAGATGALSAFPKPMRTVCPFGMPIFPPRRLSTSSLARIASAWSTKLTKPHSCHQKMNNQHRLRRSIKASRTFSGKSLKLSIAPYGANT